MAEASAKAPVKVPTVAESISLTNVGGCLAVVCKAECDGFEYDVTADGFRHCRCGHTQSVHDTLL